jgi:hypothetical protein
MIDETQTLSNISRVMMTFSLKPLVPSGKHYLVLEGMTHMGIFLGDGLADAMADFIKHGSVKE